MSNETTQLLANLQVECKESFPYIFILLDRFQTIQHRMMQGRWNARSEIINNTYKNFDTTRRKADVAKCSLHDLRRSAIANWAQHLPIQVVQQFAGHSNIATTRKYYLTVRSEDVLLASKIMNEILRGVKTD
jgi:integrase